MRSYKSTFNDQYRQFDDSINKTQFLLAILIFIKRFLIISYVIFSLKKETLLGTLLSILETALKK